MHTSRRVVIIAAAILAAGSCSFPTDQSVGVYVTVDTPSGIILRGSELTITARVWNRVAPGDSVELKNADLLWSTSSPQLATVAHGGHGVGIVTGVNAGLVQVRVIAPGFEEASAGVVSLRVANPLEIDSVTPDTVRYGQKLRVHGVGARQVFFATIGDGGVLFPDSAFDTGEPFGLGSRVFWVPYPARSSEMLAAGAGQFVAAPESTVVVPLDIFEPNELTPSAIDLDAPPTYANAPFLAFVNPALAFEDLRNRTFSTDWYRLTTASPNGPYTFLFETPGLGGTHLTFLTGTAGSGGVPDPAGWTLGSGQLNCKGYTFAAEQAPSDQMIVALTKLPSGQVDWVSHFSQQGRYSFLVARGYIVSDPRVPPDRYEENDLCDFAEDTYFNDLSLRIVLGAAWSDTLTIDNPHDVDWFMLRLSGITSQVVTIKAASQDLIAPTSGVTDRSDIDLYLFKHPNQGAGLQERARDTGSGSSSSITTTLPPGDYFVVVVDSAGVPAKYSLCMAKGTSCAPPPIVVPPLPPVAASAAAPAPVHWSRALERWVARTDP